MCVCESVCVRVCTSVYECVSVYVRARARVWLEMSSVWILPPTSFYVKFNRLASVGTFVFKILAVPLTLGREPVPVWTAHLAACIVDGRVRLVARALRLYQRCAVVPRLVPEVSHRGGDSQNSYNTKILLNSR